MESSSTQSQQEPVERIVEIKNREGLHMRPAMHLVECANGFTAEITIGKGEQFVDAKSIMQISMLAATQGTKLTIRALGTDAHEAVKILADLIENEIAKEEI
jgi:phosphocarrier protein